MSFANYLKYQDGNLIPTFDEVQLLKEADNLDDGARISDTVNYVSNATYPAFLKQTVSDNNDYTTLFVNSDLKLSNEQGFHNFFDLGLSPSQYVNNSSYYSILTNNNPNLIKKGVLNLNIDVSGGENVLFNSPSSQTLLIKDNLFYNVVDVSNTNQIIINNKRLNIEYDQDVSFNGNNYYQFNFVLTLEADYSPNYLRIESTRDNINFQQLAYLEYEVYVLSISVSRFSYRLATFNENMERVDTYQPVIYDICNNPTDPNNLNTLKLQGQSVKFSQEAVYAFLEVKNLSSSGSIEFEFKNAYSELEVAVSNAVEDGILPEKDALNIFDGDYTQLVRDASGIDRDLSQLEAEVANLDVLTLKNAVDINDLSQNKLDKANGLLAGDLNANGYRVFNMEEAGVISGGDIIFDTDSATKGGRILSSGGYFYIQSGQPNTEESIRFTKYLSSVPIMEMDLSNNIVDIDTATLKLGDLDVKTTVEDNTTEIQNNKSNIISNTNNITLKLNKSGDTMSGILNMNNNKITNVQAGNGNGDAVNRGFCNNTYLIKAGDTMTGNLNMNNNKISNLTDPVDNLDGANKQYVDSKLTNEIIDYSKFVRTIGPMAFSSTRQIQPVAFRFLSTAYQNILITGYIQIVAKSNLPVYTLDSGFGIYLVDLSSKLPIFRTYIDGKTILQNTKADEPYPVSFSGVATLQNGKTYVIAMDTLFPNLVRCDELNSFIQMTLVNAVGVTQQA